MSDQPLNPFLETGPPAYKQSVPARAERLSAPKEPDVHASMQEANQVWGNTLRTKLEDISTSRLKCIIGFGSNRRDLGKGSEESEAEAES